MHFCTIYTMSTIWVNVMNNLILAKSTQNVRNDTKLQRYSCFSWTIRFRMWSKKKLTSRHRKAIKRFCISYFVIPAVRQTKMILHKKEFCIYTTPPCTVLVSENLDPNRDTPSLHSNILYKHSFSYWRMGRHIKIWVYFLIYSQFKCRKNVPYVEISWAVQKDGLETP